MKTRYDSTATQETQDSTEATRRQDLETINSKPGSRDALEAVYGQVWDTGELTRDFTVIGFLAPYVVVCRREDDQQRSLQLQHAVRVVGRRPS